MTNPEQTRAFRTRDEQVRILSNDLAGIRPHALTDSQCALRHICEAESRGDLEATNKTAANVAALEARIAELEGALNKLVKVSGRVASLGARVGPQWVDMTVELARARAALKREGGV